MDKKVFLEILYGVFKNGQKMSENNLPNYNLEQKYVNFYRFNL